MAGKACAKCEQWKVFGEFYKNKPKKDGHDSKCKKCDKAYRQANKERISEYQKEYRQGNKEKNVEWQKEYYESNKEKLLDRASEYRQANKEILAEWQREYRKTNKEKITECAKRYRETGRGKEAKYRANLKRRSYKHKVIFTPHERKQILNRDNWTCQSCGIKVHDESKGNWDTPDKAHIDHIIPISKGGNSEPKNLRVLCRTCNLTKSDKEDEQLQLVVLRK